MLNITTFLDANACRLDKTVFYCPERDVSYTSKELKIELAMVAQGFQSFFFICIIVSVLDDKGSNVLAEGGIYYAH